MERTIKGLTKYAGNPECIGSILDGLSGYIQSILSVMQGDHNDVMDMEKSITGLFTQIIQVSDISYMLVTYHIG